ncbi:MAG: hypothetical protein IJM67_01985 [Atopobiaceae bacterium]|nr:hypothetical protein [Atopobiaceae bacterium]
MAEVMPQETQGFSLGKPTLVCRWRISGGMLPLANRHMRALRSRVVDGSRVSTELVAWAKQQVEWSLAEGSAAHPDGVLMLIVDEGGQAAMTVGPYEPLKARTLRELARRALDAAREASSTGVAPEMLAIVRDGALLLGMETEQRVSGTASLVSDLAQTLGMSVRRVEGLAPSVVAGEACAGEAMLVSDEHGVVVASDQGGPLAEKFAGGYQTLLEKARRGIRR